MRNNHEAHRFLPPLPIENTKKTKKTLRSFTNFVGGASERIVCIVNILTKRKQ